MDDFDATQDATATEQPEDRAVTRFGRDKRQLEPWAEPAERTNADGTDTDPADDERIFEDHGGL